MEFKIPTGLACLGIAVAIGQWLIAPDAISYELRFAIILAAVSLFAAGIFLVCHPTWQWFRGSFIGNPQPTLRISPQVTVRNTGNSQQLDETEVERDQNRRAVPLRIEFSESSFKQVGPTESCGLSEGQWQRYKVAIKNTTNNEIEDVQVWLTEIQPVPEEIKGCIPLPLHVTHESNLVSVMTLTAQERRLVDVVSFFSSFWQPYIRIEHTSGGAKQEIWQGDDGYGIELMVKGKGVQSSRRRFRIGVEDRNLYMTSLGQSEEEAFME